MNSLKLVVDNSKKLKTKKKRLVYGIISLIFIVYFITYLIVR